MKSDLKPPEFQAVEAIFHAALGLEPTERSRYLDGACGDNAALRQRVDALLCAHEAAALFLPETPALKSFDAAQLNRNVGDYELLEEIARGGMGVVFKARQCRLDRIVALKMMLAGGFASREQVLRFRAEVETAARLQHPNIVRIHETGEEDGRPYFSMDYVAGPNLGSLVREGPLPAKRAADYVKTIAEAIHYAHEQGVLHRDLKPSNVLIDPDERPRVTDFGLAKRMQKESFLTVTGEMMGSPNFMPPEQAGVKGVTAGRYSDVYSLGGILFYLVTGRPPFVSENVAETLHHVLNTEPVSPRLLNPGLPQDIATICLKCLEKQPSRRYQTAQHLADELKRFLRDEPIQARPIGPPEKLWRWSRRRPVIAGLVTALCLAVSLGYAGILWQWQRAQRHAGDATDKLREAYIAQARASRRSAQAGRRYDSLDVIAKAAAMNPSAAQREELRNEAIACLALPDLRVARQWSSAPGAAEGQLLFDPRAQLLARTANRGSITLCQVSNDNEVVRLPGIGSSVEWIRLFSPDSRFLAVYYSNGTNCVWDIARRQVMLALPQADSCVFSSDSRLLAASHPDGSLSIYAADSWQEVRRVRVGSYLRHLKFHPDGSKVAGIPRGRDRVEIADATTGEICATLAAATQLSCMSFSSDGAAVAAGSSEGRLYVWITATGEIRLNTQAHENRVNAVGFNHAGDLLASTSWDGSVRLFNTWTGREVVNRSGNGYQVLFGEDDRYLAYAHDGANLSLLEVAPHAGFRIFTPEKRQMGASSLAFSPDGRILATIDYGVRFWDLENGRELGFLPTEGCYSVSFEPNGTSLVGSGDFGVSRWAIERQADASTNTIQLGKRSRLAAANGYHFSSLSANGRFLAVAQRSAAAALVFDLNEELPVPVRLSPHAGVQRVAINPDGCFVATGSWGGSGVKVWDVATRKVIRELPASSHARVAFSPDGRWLATSTDDYRLYDVASWELRYKLPVVRDTASLNPLTFSPDSEILAIVNSPRNIHLYATATGQRLAVLESPEPAITLDVCFSPSSSMLAVLQRDQAVQIWDLHHIRQRLAEFHLDWNHTFSAAVKRTNTLAQ